MSTLAPEEVRTRLASLPGWAADGDAITKQFEFGGFPEAIAFVVRAGFAAEKANHHPDLDIRYSKVRVVLSTHSEGGVTEKDVELAGALETLAQ